MNKKNTITISLIGICLVLSISIFSFKKTNAGKEFDETSDFVELNKHNPYAENFDKAYSSVDLYAKGEHIIILKTEMDWQTRVFELNGSSNLEQEAFEYIGKFKTLFYYAVEEGFLATDEELDQAIKFNVDLYEEYKKDGETDHLYESYGGAQDYEDAMREVTRKSLSIENFMKSKRAEFEETLDADKLYSEESEKLWNERRNEITEELINAENINKV